MAKKLPLEFRLCQGKVVLKEPDDPLEHGERRLVIIRVSVMHASVLFTDDDAHGQAVRLFATTYHCAVRGENDGPIDTTDMHETVFALNQLIVGAALGASMSGKF